MEQSLRMHRVTWPITGGKMIHIFEIPDPRVPITLSLSGSYDED